MSRVADSVEKKFRELFREEPLLVGSPGRANLIGEHTDYNLGYVLPCAIDRTITLALSPRRDMRCSAYALDKRESVEFAIGDLKHSAKHWPNYVEGVVDQLVKAGCDLAGFNCVFGGDIPIGAGLSSSAALEAGLAFGLNQLFNLGIDRRTLVRLAQRAENEFVGVQCGIMDQFINIFGESGSAVRLDCRTLDYQYFRFDVQRASIVLFNSNVSHSLRSSDYNQRRKECQEGVTALRKKEKAVSSLRDVTPEMLVEYGELLSPVVRRRCKFVVEENARVLAACTALEKNDLAAFGRLMFAAHDGLSREYEVSCPELDFLVNLVRDDDHVFGARMMGGGFGGCTINLVEPGYVEALGKSVGEKYLGKFGIHPELYVTTISAGTHIIHDNGND